MEKERDPVCVQVGRNIRRLRWASGLSQGDLGGKLGVTYQQVQKYETGKDQLGVVKLHKLRMLFACDYAAFFVGLGGEASDPPNTEDEYVTLRWSRAVQSIGDREVRQSLIEHARKLAKCF